MKEVYFDTNIYSHLLNHQHGVTEKDVTRLFENIRADKVRVYLSDGILEETMGALMNQEREAIRRLRFIYRVVNRKRYLRPAVVIIRETILAYAKGQRVPSYFTSPGPLNRMLKKQNEVDLLGLQLLAWATQDRITDYVKVREAYYKTLRPEAKREMELKKRPTLQQYWNNDSKDIVEQFVDLYGVLKECRERGIEGLLNFLPMKALSAGVISNWYMNTYDRTKMNRGDIMDMDHVVYGAVVGTLVTHDSRFSTCLKRLPVDGFEIIDLHTLLNRV